AEGYVEDWDLEQLWSALGTLYPVGIDHRELVGAAEAGESDLDREGLREALLQDARNAYAKREQQINEIAGEGGMRELERRVLLSVLDRKWREHLYEMDYLKEGIGLRAMAQRDPLVEYQREGYDMFIAMLDGLKEESVGFLFNLQVEAGTPQGGGPAVSVTASSAAAAAATGQAVAQQSAQPVASEQAQAPVALRAKGLDDAEPRGLTLSGPAEDGTARVSRVAGDTDAPDGTRRERREAARADAKAKKGPKSKRRR
ncbi:MAG: preprotein translocase subunit SecA, partial [Nocardiaceae bacterium]|nr:preprotein translocase subunit SecA [Nocardiaceae bacterium]